MVATCVSPSGVASPSSESAVMVSVTAGPSEKAKTRKQTLMLDTWLSLHGDNLYPCREEKEKLAKDTSMTYIQVNRWFANRRRKQTKRRKADASSPRSTATSTLRSAEEQNEAVFAVQSPLSEAGVPKERYVNDMVIHASVAESLSCDKDLLKGEVRQETPPPQVAIGLHQVPDLQRPLKSPLLTPDRQRMGQTSVDNKMMATPPAYAALSPLASFTNVSAAAALTAAAAQATNPFLLAAALGIQQSAAAALPWSPNAQSLATMMPYLQQLHAQQQAALAQQIVAHHVAAAQQMASVSHPVGPQHPPQQWLSPPPSAASIPDNTSSPLFLNSEESYSSLSEISELSPRPRGDVISPYKEPSLLLTDEEFMIDSLIEERKDLSEKESIAVAVLAGMAAYQR